MNMRTSHDPYGSPTTLVDKLIGNAYEVVKYVARHIEHIKYVAHNMEAIDRVSQGMKTSKLLMGVTGVAGETTAIPLPENVSPTTVLASSVIVVGTDGNLYTSDSGWFTSAIQEGALRITLKGAAPHIVEAASVRWLLTYGVM